MLMFHYSLIISAENVFLFFLTFLTNILYINLDIFWLICFKLGLNIGVMESLQIISSFVSCFSHNSAEILEIKRSHQLLKDEKIKTEYFFLKHSKILLPLKNFFFFYHWIIKDNWKKHKWTQ